MKTKIKFLAMMLMGIMLSVNVWGDQITLNFEGTGTFPYNSDWTVTNGSAYTSSSCEGTYSCASGDPAGLTLTYTKKIEGIITRIQYCASKTSTNTTEANFGLQTSSNGSVWSSVIGATNFNLASTTNGQWTNVDKSGLEIDLSEGGYIRLYKQGSSTAVRLVDNIVITYTNTAGPNVSSSENSLAFGNVDTESNKQLTTNVSGSSLTGNITLSITGTNEDMFSVSPTSLTQTSGTVAATAVTVTYTPTATGSHSATLNIASAGATTQTVSLTGTGVAPKAKHAVNWHVGGDITTVRVAEGDPVEFPENPETPVSCGEKVFTGWTNAPYENASVAPTYYNSATMETSDLDFYAVFADVSESSTEFHKGTVDDLKDGRRTLLVEYTDRKAVNSSIVPTKYLGVTNVTISNDKITVANDANCVWNAYKSSDKYQFKQGNNYLNSTGNDLYCNSTSDTWAFASGGTGYTIKSTNGTKYLEYYSNYTEFTCYSPASSNPYYFHIYVSDMEVSNYTTSCVECEEKVTITKGAENDGTFTLSRSGDNVCIDDDATIIVSNITPATHYHIAEVTTSNGTVTGPVDGKYTVTVTSNATIGVTFEQDDKVTVTWVADGTTVGTTNVWPGETANAPADPEDIPDCADAFVGWSTSTLTGTDHSAPTDLFNTTSPEITADVTFNAVFATAVGGGTVTHTMDVPQDAALSGYAARNFTDDQGYTWSGTFSGFDNDGEKFWSLSKNSENYHISSPTFAGNVSSIKFWVRQTANGDPRTIILRSNTLTAQPSVSDMGLTAVVSQNANVQEVTITPTSQEFTQFNIYVSAGFGFRKIQVVTGGGVTYSNYVTSCATYTVTFKSNGADVTTVNDVAPGQQVTAPTWAEIDNKVAAKNVCTEYLIGWSTNSHYTNPSAAPDDILKPNAEGKITIPGDITGDVTYYAVYADVAGE